MRHLSSLAVVLLVLSVFAVGQKASPATPPQQANNVADASAPHTSDDPDLARETQLATRSGGEPHTVCPIWWIPTEFWQQSSLKRGVTPEKAAETFKSLRDY